MILPNNFVQKQKPKKDVAVLNFFCFLRVLCFLFVWVCLLFVCLFVVYCFCSFVFCIVLFCLLLVVFCVLCFCLFLFCFGLFLFVYCFVNSLFPRTLKGVDGKANGP